MICSLDAMTEVDYESRCECGFSERRMIRLDVRDRIKLLLPLPALTMAMQYYWQWSDSMVQVKNLNKKTFSRQIGLEIKKEASRVLKA